MTPLNGVQRGAPGSGRCSSCNLSCNDEVLPAILITKPKIGFTWSKMADLRFRRGYCHGKNRIPLTGATRKVVGIYAAQFRQPEAISSSGEVNRQVDGLGSECLPRRPYAC